MSNFVLESSYKVTLSKSLNDKHLNQQLSCPNRNLCNNDQEQKRGKKHFHVGKNKKLVSKFSSNTENTIRA